MLREHSGDRKRRWFDREWGAYQGRKGPFLWMEVGILLRVATAAGTTAIFWNATARKEPQPEARNLPWHGKTRRTNRLRAYSLGQGRGQGNLNVSLVIGKNRAILGLHNLTKRKGLD